MERKKKFLQLIKAHHYLSKEYTKYSFLRTKKLIALGKNNVEKSRHDNDAYEYNALSIQQLEIVQLLYNQTKLALHLTECKVCTLEEQNT